MTRRESSSSERNLSGGRRRFWLKIAAFSVFLIFLLAAVLYTQSLDARARTGETAPNFALPAVDGGEAALSDFRGRIVLVNFWHEWCVTCAAEVEHFERIHRHYDGRVVVIGINRGDPPSLRDRFINDHGLTYLNLWDRRNRVSDRYTVRGVPETFLIDADGVLQSIYRGPVPPDVLAEEIEALMRQES